MDSTVKGGEQLGNGYYAVSSVMVLAAQSVFHVRSSLLEAGEKRLLLTAQSIAKGSSKGRWGHHAVPVMQKFCEFTATPGQPALPWQELVEDASEYDGLEGISPRTGNRALGTTQRYTVNANALETAIAAMESAEAFAAAATLPLALIQALRDGTWPSISEETASRLRRLIADEPLQEALLIALGQESAAEVDSGVPPVSPGSAASPRNVASGSSKTNYGLLALAGLALAVMFIWAGAGFVGPQADQQAVGSEPADTQQQQAPQPELVGYWTYDGVDGQRLADGLVLVDVPGTGIGARWTRRLQLVTHAELPARERQVWPVELHRDARKVCINYPDYPTYPAFIDLPGDTSDGVYLFGPCTDVR